MNFSTGLSLLVLLLLLIFLLVLVLILVLLFLLLFLVHRPAAGIVSSMSAAASEESLLGKVIADAYHLVEIRGRGAFGTVFKAHQYFCSQFVRPVAVKVTRQTGLTPASAAALFGDAVMLAQIQAGGPRAGKEHLVPIHAMGLLPQEQGRGYIVMEYVDGAPLVAHIRTAGQIDIALALRYIKDLCRGLGVLHAQGAVHRDLKPDNIIVDRAGVVRLVDFGLAAFTDPRTGFAPGSMGTFTYMAPETVLGRSTPAADIYGVGLIMYELFTGGGPHLNVHWPREESRYSENYQLKVELHFTPPSRIQSEIRRDFPWLDRVIARCLATDPARRYADAGQLLAAIENAAPAEPEPPVPERPAYASMESDTLIAEMRGLLGERAFDRVVDRLDVYRPAEWAVLDRREARLLRLLAQAYLGRGDVKTARDCLEQLRTAAKEQPLLEADELSDALGDLSACYRKLGQADAASRCEQEARRARHGHPFAADSAFPPR
jgi:hypothetical protein